MRNAEETFAGIVLCFLKLNFCCFHAVQTKKFPRFFQMFSILKLFVFPAVAHFLGKELVEQKSREVRTVYILGKEQSTTPCQR